MTWIKLVVVVLAALATGCARPDDAPEGRTVTATPTALPEGWGGEGIMLEWEPKGERVDLLPGGCETIQVTLTARSIEITIHATVVSSMDPVLAQVTAHAEPPTYSFEENGTNTGAFEICAEADAESGEAQLSLDVTTSPQVPSTTQTIRVRIGVPAQATS